MSDHYRVPQASGDYCDADGEDWPCPNVRAGAAFIARACELWNAIPNDVKVILAAESALNGLHR